MMNSEKGEALPLALLALAVGMLIVTPFLGHVSTSLTGSRIYNQAISEQYSADAGVEYAIWQLMNGQAAVPEFTLNDNTAKVTIEDEGGQIYKITATATSADGSSTTIEARVSYRGSDIFTTGNSGTILRYDGSIWNKMFSGTTTDLYGIWGSSDNDVFAVGSSGAILRYNGTVWSSMTSGTTRNLQDIWGSSNSNVFAVGNSGAVLRYNGTVWSSMTSGTTKNLYGIWGSSDNDVFAVGNSGAILHYDGTAWSPMTSVNANYNGVWGTSSTNVFTVGSSGTILHYDGIVWGKMTSGTTKQFQGIWGIPSGGEVKILTYNIQ